MNIEGTRNVCEAAVENGIKKVVHFSSVDAFYRFPIDEPLLEDRKLIDDESGMPYDYSKAEGQRIVLEFCKQGLDASIIHPTSIVGPNDFKPGLPMQAFVDMANGKTKLMPDWGYNFIDVRDLCDTAISAVENGRKGQNYIIGGEYHSYLYIAELMGKQNGRKVVYGKLPEFITYLALPYENIKSLINKKPRLITLDSIHTAQTGNKVVPSSLAREELGHNPILEEKPSIERNKSKEKFKGEIKNRPPVVTIMGFSLAGLFGGSLIVEILFGIPGVGRISLDSVYSRDYPVIMAIVLLGSSAVSYTHLTLPTNREV